VSNIADKTAFRSWLIILALALLFFCYGIFMFLTVGDKGPPPWDFGVVGDIPGESAYSTHRVQPGGPGPEPQHISQRPSQVETERQKEQR
jgi:hypothetical protein